MPTPDESRPLARGEAAPQPGGELTADAAPWVFYGSVAGVLGAALVALFFFVVDLREGAPLATPAALGSGLFRGQPLAAGAPAEPILVLGYTAIHGGVFLAVGLTAAFALMGSTRRRGAATAAGLAVAFFAFFELFFLGFAFLMQPGLVGDLGAGRVALANLLAAVAMALYLLRAPLQAPAD